MKQKQTNEKLAEKIKTYESELVDKYGFVIWGEELRHLLGYRNAAAFRMAVKRGTLPIPTFTVPGKRRIQARTKDIAKWLAEIEVMIEQQSVDNDPEGGDNKA